MHSGARAIERRYRLLVAPTRPGVAATPGRGVLVAAAERFGLPIHAIGVGEAMDDLREFDPLDVARAIAGAPRG